MEKEQMIEDIIAMIDGTMAEGAGHVNVKIDENGKIEKEVKTMGCTDCSINSMPCQVPTIFLDGEDDDL